MDVLPRYGAHRQQFCLHCRGRRCRWSTASTPRTCTCAGCGRSAERAVVFDPRTVWWIDGAGELWHESAGVFVRAPGGRFLFFDRTAYPLALTVPAGHVEVGEQPHATALRELSEEVGITATALRPISSTCMPGDTCRRGCDAHVWHAYLLDVDDTCTVRVNGEGERPVWLTLDELAHHSTTFAVRRVVEGHRTALLAP